jgi:anthranilate 1,2-dioxygenase ferredoxin component
MADPMAQIQDRDWASVCASAELTDEKMLTARVGEWQVLVVRSGDGLSAFNDCCPHQSARLSEGRLRRGALMCPLHGARFDLASGRCVGAGYAPLLRMPIRERDGFIEVAPPQRSPTPDEIPKDTL